METVAKLELHQYGDRELWYAEAEDASWRLPLIIEWRLDKASDTHYAHVVPAVCLYYAQALSLQSLLQPHDIQGRLDQWVITRRMAEALLHKAPGITPARYYLWPHDDHPPLLKDSKDLNVALKKPRADQPTWTSFAQYLSKERKISVSIINAVLRGIAEEAPVWMVRERKPLDLGFCRLIAVPFRQNWKEIVAFKTKFMKLPSMLRLPESEIWSALEQAGIPEILTSPHNVALRRGWKGERDTARLDYTIEAIPSEQFEKAANRIEGQRMSRGGAAYITEFEDTVEALYKSLVLALRSYMSKVRLSFAEVRIGGRQRVLNFVPVLPGKTRVRKTPLNCLPLRLMDSDSGFNVFGAGGDANIIQTAIAGVPPLPGIPQEAPDMREREINGALELINGSGTGGLPLLSAGESKTEAEPMLVESAHSEPRLDDSGDRGDIII